MPKALVTKAAHSKFHENVPVDAYILARGGAQDEGIAEAMGVSINTFNAWIERHPTLKYALEQARATKGREKQFAEYVYKQLPQDLRDLWDKINYWSEARNGYEKIEALLANEGDDVRMSLWFHALIDSNFNASEACRKTCVSYRQFQHWKENVPEFPKLIDEMEWHKNNFFEGGLVGLVKEGNVLATLFANRTRNAARGYDAKVKVEHSGEIAHKHQHNVVPIDKLGLDIEERKKLLAKVREQKALPNGESNAVIDIEEGIVEKKSAFWNDE